MTLNQYPTEEALEKIRRLYERSFPKSEKKPWRVILDKCTEGSMKIISIEEKSAFLGLMIFILHSDLVLLDYFAISEEHRGEGIGSLALSRVASQLDGKRLLLEIEDPEDTDADNLDERVRRSHFYARLGFVPRDYKIDLFGVRMLLLSYADRAVSFEEYHSIFTGVFSPKIARNVNICF